MKYIKQFAIIMTVCLLGELLAQLLPFTIPASVYGLFLMLIALMTKIIKPSHVKETSDFLMDVMPIMFVPASVGLVVSWGLLKEILIPVIIVSVLGTLVVMIASGKTVDVLMKLGGGAVEKKTTDDGEISERMVEESMLYGSQVESGENQVGSSGCYVVNSGNGVENNGNPVANSGSRVGESEQEGENDE